MPEGKLISLSWRLTFVYKTSKSKISFFLITKLLVGIQWKWKLLESFNLLEREIIFKAVAFLIQSHDISSYIERIKRFSRSRNTDHWRDCGGIAKVVRIELRSGVGDEKKKRGRGVARESLRRHRVINLPGAGRKRQ